MDNSTSIPKRLIPKVKFAELCGFKRPYVAVLVKKQLKEANHGDNIDLNHPCVIAYLKKRSESPTRTGAKRGPKPGTRRNKVPETAHESKKTFIPNEFVDYADWTIRQVLTKFGTEIQFNSFLKATKDITAIKFQELTMEKERGILVERDLVDGVVFRAFETLFLRILADGSKTLSRKIHAMTKNGDTPEECEAEAKKVLSKLLKTSKREIILGMKRI